MCFFIKILFIFFLHWIIPRFAKVWYGFSDIILHAAFVYLLIQCMSFCCSFPVHEIKQKFNWGDTYLIKKSQICIINEKKIVQYHQEVQPLFHLAIYFLCLWLPINRTIILDSQFSFSWKITSRCLYSDTLSTIIFLFYYKGFI